MTAVVCDLDGVVYVERTPIPGAGGALQALADAGIMLVFVTNNSTKSADDVVAGIAATTGFVADPRRVVTSGMATAHYLQGLADSAYVVGGKGLATALVDAGIEVTEDWRRADAVVAGLDRDLSYEKLRRATLALRSGARFVASNVDATFPGEDGQYPGGGSIVAALETASDRTAFVCGKPHEPARALVSQLVGDSNVLVVGDRLETDIAMADAAGWQSALVLTGVTDAEELQPGSPRASVVLSSIRDLPGYLGITS